MNITELTYAVAIAKAGSLSAAARNLYTAQSNLSRAINTLEKEYGIKIFERSNKGVKLTPEGEIFIKQAHNIIDEIDKLHLCFQSADNDTFKLKISIPRASYAAEAFVSFVNTNIDIGNIDLHFKECSSMDALDNILKYNYDIALIRYEKSNENFYTSYFKLKGLSHQVLFDYNYRLLVSSDSPLADKKNLSPADLQECLELSHGDSLLPNGVYEKPFDDSVNQKKIHIYERGSQFALLKGLPNSYMWVSPMPDNIIREYGLKQIECPFDTTTMRDTIVFPSSQPIREITREFIATLEEFVKAL